MELFPFTVLKRIPFHKIFNVVFYFCFFPLIYFTLYKDQVSTYYQKILPIIIQKADAKENHKRIKLEALH